MKTTTVKRQTVLAAIASALAVGTLSGCAVGRGQESAGALVDDAAITTKVKSKFAADSTVSAMSISVETLQGVVQLSGFAKSAEEKAMAEKLARDTKGVADVKNNIIVKS